MSSKVIDKLKEKKKKLLFQYERMKKLKDEGKIEDYCDLYGDDDPTILFPYRLKKYEHLLDDEDTSCLSPKDIKKKSKFNYLLRKLGPNFLSSKQIYEDRDELLNLPKGTLGEANIPDEPVIFVPNHGFRDDVLGTMIAAERPTYALCASLPLFYNTFDGILLYNSGIILTNRKIKSNKKASMDKAKMFLQNGGSLIFYPEGVWNKTPNKLHIPLWNGVFKLAKETGVKIVPVVHYIKDPSYTLDKKENPFHTLIDDPIDPNDYTEEELKRIIEDKFSTWSYLMMEKYGKTTRDELLEGYEDSKSLWEEMLRKSVESTGKYDKTIERTSDYRPRDVVTPDTVFEPIANLEVNEKNKEEVEYAKKLVKQVRENDFQRRF